MAISVVIPAYNAAEFIAGTLETVLQQTLRPDEIIVIDDGSSDQTAQIAEAFDPLVRVIRRQNERQAASRNFGAKEASSEWIAFLDADDLWEPQKLERQMEELARHPEADLCYTSRVHFTMDGDRVRFGNTVIAAEPAALHIALYRNTNFLPSSVVVRRSTFLASGGFDSRYVPVEDWELWLRLLHANAVFVACREPLMKYRVHLGSDSHKAFLVFVAKEKIFARHVRPYLPWITRWGRHNQSLSEHQAGAAFCLRKNKDVRGMQMMVKSILRSPFYDSYRYKALLHMCYLRLRFGRI